MSVDIRSATVWGLCLLLLSALSACSERDGVAATVQSKYPPATVEMQLRQVSEHAYVAQGASGVATDNQGFISNAGVVITAEGVVVFDALGTPSLAQLLVQKIREKTDQPIVRVIVSHYHADHIYGLQVFEELGAEIVAAAGSEIYLGSEQARERLEERRFSLEPWVNEATRLVEPDVYLTEPLQFELGGVRFEATPVGKAHSDGDLTLFVEPDRVLFSGDLIFEGRVPFLGNANSKHWLEVLARMTTGGIRALVPGHGPVAEDPAAAVGLTHDYLAYLREKMGAAVADFVPFDEAYANTDWSRFEHLPAFQEANRRNAYQVYLSMEAESFE